MYAIFESGGKQHRVSPGDKVRLEKLEGEPGQKISFDRVLFASDEGGAKIGTPLVDGASVEAEISAQDRADKVLVFKRKRRKGFHKKIGHRQPFTEVKVTDIRA
jgi:large subunit ribosomal protein L21